MKSHLVPVRFNNKMAFFFEPWRTQEQSESFVQGIYRNVKSSLEAPWKSQGLLCYGLLYCFRRSQSQSVVWVFRQQSDILGDR